MRNFRKNKGRNFGFTLIEMVVVLLIISVTTALVAPRVGSSWKRIEDSDFLQEFTETIRRARLAAMNSGRPVAFRLNGAERIYDFANLPQKPIPLNVQVFSEHLEKDPVTGDFLVTFYPDGSLVGNDFEVVFDNQRTFRITIHPLFGTVGVLRLPK
ncbi:MAG: Tfp pilus assembly protein FimT/FimU [Syntrophobacteraceae bacterium]